MARSPLLQARKGHLGRGNEHEQQVRQGQQKEEVRTGSLRTQNRHETGSTTARSVDEIALIRDTINHYGPVFIASLSIQIRRAGVQKKFGGRAGRPYRDISERVDQILILIASDLKLKRVSSAD